MNPYQRKNSCEIERNFAEHKKYATDILNGLIRTHGFQVDFHEKEDLIQIGLINLLECYRNYDESQGVTFKSYSYKRIAGGYIDWFRKNSSIPRRQQKLFAQYRELQANFSRENKELTLQEASEILGVETEKLSAYILRWESRNSVSIDDESNALSIGNRFTDNPAEITMENDKTEAVKSAINELSQRDQIILDLYFNQEVSLKDIGEKLGLSEGRVSQLKNQLVKKIRNKVAYTGAES